MIVPALRRGVHRAERLWDRTRFAVKRRAGLLGTPTVMTYRGFAAADGVWLRGRVLEDQGVVTAPHSDSTLRNIWLTLKRYETDEVGGASLSPGGPAAGTGPSLPTRKAISTPCFPSRRS
ncbi:hypothetical protein [Jiella sp. M17.18]|uniref:hypothetical protein n=1 Tax=Jiella sp. M17.18 TaxID=3234247 RepID=UPI0034DE33C6